MYRRTRVGIVGFGISALVALLVAAALLAQVPTSAPQQPTFKTGVNYVRLDAYPTLDGRPVPDLTKDDFEIYEDGVLQELDGFEHIVVRARAAAEERVEPRNVREANQMAADARNRLFVLFLDTYHVTDPTSTHNGVLRMPGPTTARAPLDARPTAPLDIERALIHFLDRAVGPADLFAALTPEMDVADLSFTRRPDNFEEFVRTSWARRFSWDNLDPEEERWWICYPPDDPCHCWDGILQQMVARRREQLTLKGLRRLVDRLGELREERKAVLLVSEGWSVFRPNQQLGRPVARVSDPPACTCPVVIPRGKDIYMDPQGKLTAGTDPRTYMTVDWQQCESARATMAHVDDAPLYRDLMDAANRTNTTFYPVDPRGLAVWDTPMNYKDVPQTPKALQTLPPDQAPLADAATLRQHLEALRSLATATDGTMTETNDLNAGLKKIADDLSDYYLLAYSSTNAKADGRFRKITVRVKRPGVVVRARRGYLVATEAELAARKAAAAALDPEMAARNKALASLGTIRADRPLHVAAGVAWQTTTGGGPAQPLIWVAGNLDVSATREAGWSSGTDAAISLISAAGRSVLDQHATLSSAGRGFLVYLRAPSPAGEYLVRVKASGKEGTGAEASEQVRVRVAGGSPATSSMLGEPILFRRGPFTSPTFQPTADLQFRRAELLRVDVPLVSDAATVSARVLDRRGEALPIPVTIGRREEAGVRLATAELGLAPLAPGDYLIEVSTRQGDRQEKRLVAIRIVP